MNTLIQDWLCSVASGQVEAKEDPGFTREQWQKGGAHCLTLLHRTVIAQDLSKVEAILHYAPYLVDSRDALGLTPLFHTKTPKLAKVLLEAGANPLDLSKTGLTAWAYSWLTQSPSSSVLEKTLSLVERNQQWQALFSYAWTMESRGQKADDLYRRLMEEAPLIQSGWWDCLKFHLTSSLYQRKIEFRWKIIDQLLEKGASLNDNGPNNESLWEVLSRSWFWDSMTQCLHRGINLPSPTSLKKMQTYILGGVDKKSPWQMPNMSSPEIIHQSLDAMKAAGIDLISSDPHTGLSAMARTRPGHDGNRWPISCWLLANGAPCIDEKGEVIDLREIARQSKKFSEEDVFLAEKILLSRQLKSTTTPDSLKPRL